MTRLRESLGVGSSRRAADLESFCTEPDGPPFRVARRAAGAFVLRRGAPAEDVYCIRSGRVRLSIMDASGTERTCAMRGPGSLLGLEALLGLRSLFDVRMDIDGQVGVITPARFERWIGDNSDHALALVRHVVGEEMKLAVERNLLDGSAASRLARFLFELETNRFLNAWSGVRRQDVAKLLGMRPETLSRAIREFRRKGIVDARLRVLDSRAIRRLAGESNGN